MADYWIKRVATSLAEGPYTGGQLKVMAAKGELRREALVSADRVKWVVATKVKGLFPSPPTAGGQTTIPVPRVQRPAAPGAKIVPPPVFPPIPPPANVPLADYANPAGGHGFIGKHRDLKWFLITSIVLLGLAVLQVFLRLGTLGMMLHSIGPGGSRPSAMAPAAVMSFALLSTLIIFLGLAAVIGLYVYFLVWVWLVHDEMARYTNGAYPISAGQALGFCFIPFFNMGWIVYMPYKLAKDIDDRLGRTQQITNPSSVMVFQILQQVLNVPCICVFTWSPIFLALTIHSIQNGLNALWGTPEFTPADPSSFRISSPAVQRPPTSAAETPAASKRIFGLPIWVLGASAAGVLLACGLVIWAVAPIVSQAREAANRVKIAAEMKQIGAAIRQYAVHNGGQFPSQLADVVASENLSPALLISPHTNDTTATGSTPQELAASVAGGGHCSFAYSGGGLTMQTVNTDTVVMYEANNPHSVDGMNVLFGDWHVEFVPPTRAQQIMQNGPASPMPAAQPQASSATAEPPPAQVQLSEDAAGLLSQVDLKGGTRSGHWSIVSSGIRSSGHGPEILNVPATLPAEYDLSLDFVRLGGTDELGVKLRDGSANLMVVVGAARDTRITIDGLPRARGNSPAATASSLTPQGTQHHLLVSVRKGSIEAKLDDRSSFKFTGDLLHIKLPTRWRASANDPLDLASLNSSFEFRRLTIAPVTSP